MRKSSWVRHGGVVHSHLRSGKFILTQVRHGSAVRRHR